MKSKKLWKIPVAKEVENRLGINTANRSEILFSLRIMMRKLRAVLKKNTQIYYASHPKDRQTCDTCAFNVKTRRRGGFLATSRGLMWAIHNRKSFVCHANQPGHKKNEIDPHRLMVCMGFALVADDPVAKQAAARANTEISKVLSDGIEEAS